MKFKVSILVFVIVLVFGFFGIPSYAKEGVHPKVKCNAADYAEQKRVEECKSKHTSAQKTVSATTDLNQMLNKSKKVEIVDEITFVIEGTKCRLLGIVQSKDATKRKKALNFSRKWFDSIGGYFAVVNETQPLNNQGDQVVWLEGADMYNSILNAELLRLGLVELDNSHFQDYCFADYNVSQCGSNILLNWQKHLLDAQKGYARGEKPHVVFSWNE